VPYCGKLGWVGYAGISSQVLELGFATVGGVEPMSWESFV
jgi:hypothetical protein